MLVYKYQNKRKLQMGETLQFSQHTIKVHFTLLLTQKDIAACPDSSLVNTTESNGTEHITEMVWASKLPIADCIMLCHDRVSTDDSPNRFRNGHQTEDIFTLTLQHLPAKTLPPNASPAVRNLDRVTTAHGLENVPSE